MNEEMEESLKKVINAELKKGTMLHVEVAEVLGTDIVGWKYTRKETDLPC